MVTIDLVTFIIVLKCVQFDPEIKAYRQVEHSIILLLLPSHNRCDRILRKIKKYTLFPPDAKNPVIYILKIVNMALKFAGIF